MNDVEKQELIDRVCRTLEAMKLNLPNLATALEHTIRSGFPKLATAVVEDIQNAIELPRVERPTVPGFYFAKQTTDTDKWDMFKVTSRTLTNDDRKPRLIAYVADNWEGAIDLDALYEWRGPLPGPS